MQPDSFKKELGKKGENEASFFLGKQGFKILERNYRCRLGEIDLIAEKDHSLYFVEVKTRRDCDSVSPLELISRQKERHLSRVALHYLAVKKKENVAASFALVIVEWKESQPHCEWIPDLFNSREGY